jgi:hypothetical protein
VKTRRALSEGQPVTRVLLAIDSGMRKVDET